MRCGANGRAGACFTGFTRRVGAITRCQPGVGATAGGDASGCAEVAGSAAASGSSGTTVAALLTINGGGGDWSSACAGTANASATAPVDDSSAVARKMLLLPWRFLFGTASPRREMKMNVHWKKYPKHARTTHRL